MEAKNVLQGMIKFNHTLLTMPSICLFNFRIRQKSLAKRSWTKQGWRQMSIESPMTR